jgi:alkylation response protein AidB-like acyl-CoA dehydrogenase
MCVRFTLTDDQSFFRETTNRFLDDLVPVAELRARRDDPVGFDADYWRRGAELGWTSLLVAEEHGGGSISGSGLHDLALVADAFGRHAAPGPLTTANVVAGALSRTGGSHGVALAALVAGEATASWCVAEPRPNDRFGAISLDVRVEGDDVVLCGVKRPVESAPQASWLLVTGRTGAGLTQVLVPTDAAGITVTPLQTVDLTRRFHKVVFDEVRVPASHVVGEVGGAAADVAWQHHVAIVLGCAESVGAMQVGFEMTVEYAFDRYAFGRPLAGYQALRHRFADQKMWLEASHAITDRAVDAVAAAEPDAATYVSAAKAYVGHYGSELFHDGVQIHGGIGVTFEHDLHLYLRRHTVERTLHGTPVEHRRLLSGLAGGTHEEDAA